MSTVLRRVMLGLAVIGLGVAIYLTVVHYVGFSALACGGGHGGVSSCQTVQSSVWSKLAGVPVAVLGLIGYVFILGSMLLPDREETRLATLGLTLIGFGFSAYLTYRELFTIHAICEWCLSSAVILTLLLIGSVVRFLIGGPPATYSIGPGGAYPDGASANNGRARGPLAGRRA
ncbi:MAG TPA: vitamin K epoxide reductase family protein [Solirubrobacteraceae bacterium]|nr:vitamin K epoxide reductase family protein [Solirubrobacteraceae bacterium]